MKKCIISFLAIVLILCLSGCIAEDVSLLYSESTVEDGFSIAVNKTADCCFVGEYECPYYTQNLEITVPDDYEGIPITQLGGYQGRGVPSPFSISVADIYMNAPKGSNFEGVYSGNLYEYNISEEYTVTDLPFVLNLGKNIETIKYVVSDEYYPHLNDDGSVTFYHPVVSINCSADNKNFYSENGKLYNKKTNELISEFDYAQ